MKHQLGIAKMQTINLKRVRRLMFLARTAHGILMVVGRVADSLNEIKDRLITGRNKAAPKIWFGIKMIKHKLIGRAFFAKVYAAIAGP
jgi:hypothetical protein